MANRNILVFVLTTIAVVAVLNLAIVGGTGDVEQDSNEIFAELSEDTVNVGESFEVQIILNEAPDGISGYYTELYASNDVVEIVNVTSAGDFDIDVVSLSEDHIALEGSTFSSETEDILMAEVELLAVEEGNFTVTPTDDSVLYDDDGEAFYAQSVSGSGEVITEPSISPEVTDEINTIGDESTVELTLNHLPDGVHGYDMAVEISDEVIFGDVVDTGEFNVEVDRNGNVSLAGETSQTELTTDVLLAEIEVEGVEEGEYVVEPVYAEIISDEGETMYPELRQVRGEITADNGEGVTVFGEFNGVSPGETAELDLVVDEADAGISGAEVTVEVENDAVALVGEVRDGESDPNHLVIDEVVDEQDDLITYQGVIDDIGAVDEPQEDFSLGVIEFGAVDVGVTEVGVDVELFDEDGDSYEVNTDVDELEVTDVTFPNPLPIDDDRIEGEPTDVNGDGKYEDITGSGEASPEDAQVLLSGILFDDLEEELTQEQIEALDFNDDGELTPQDAQELLSKILFELN